jgi:hypothetical protein
MRFSDGCGPPVPECTASFALTGADDAITSTGTGKSGSGKSGWRSFVSGSAALDAGLADSTAGLAVSLLSGVLAAAVEELAGSLSGFAIGRPGCTPALVVAGSNRDGVTAAAICCTIPANDRGGQFRGPLPSSVPPVSELDSAESTEAGLAV